MKKIRRQSLCIPSSFILSKEAVSSMTHADSDLPQAEHALL
jgi:hypothetical protein